MLLKRAIEHYLKRLQRLCVFKHGSVSRSKCAVRICCYFIKLCRYIYSALFCRYDVKLDFKDHTSTATIKLEWKHAQDAVAFTVIPSGRLAHRLVPTHFVIRAFAVAVVDSSFVCSEVHIAGSPFSVPFQAV